MLARSPNAGEIFWSPWLQFIHHFRYFHCKHSSGASLTSKRYLLLVSNVNLLHFHQPTVTDVFKLTGIYKNNFIVLIISSYFTDMTYTAFMIHQCYQMPAVTSLLTTGMIIEPLFSNIAQLSKALFSLSPAFLGCNWPVLLPCD